MYCIMYRTADMVSRVSNSLAGSFTYYADPQKALDTGLFVEKVWSWQDEHNCYDFLDTRYKQATDADLKTLRRA